MFLLDTNAISELRKGKSTPSDGVRIWAASVPLDRQYLSAITVLELEVGVLSMERRDKVQGALLRSWLQAILYDFNPRVLTFGPVTALLCAKLHVPNRMPERDAMLAATAQEHGMTIVTRNVADFERTGLPIVNPWKA